MCKKLVHTKAFYGKKTDKCLEIQHLNNVLQCGNHSISGIGLNDSGPLNYDAHPVLCITSGVH